MAFEFVLAEIAAVVERGGGAVAREVVLAAIG